MTGSDLRALIFLAIPPLAAFLGLAVFGVLPVAGAVVGAIVSLAGLAWSWRRVKSGWEGVGRAEEDIEEELRQEFVRQARLAEDYEVIFDLVPEPMLVFGPDRHILHANKALVDLLGTDPIDSDLTLAFRHPAVVEAVDAVLRMDGSQQIVEFTQGGEVERHLVARVATLPPRRGRGGGGVLTVHDMTAIKNTEQMRSDFVANVSHELRTPLSSLVGFIETLRGPAHDDAEAREKFLGLMEEQADRITRLVGDLLSLSQIEANEFTKPSENIRIEDLVSIVIRTLEPEAAKKNMTIVIDAVPDIPVIRGDSEQLMAAVQNLVHNAVKFGRENTEVRVGIRVTEGQILAVSVTDRGEGISAQHVPRLTERFYRVDKARSRDLGGTGLGLAIVKHVLNRHHGRLSVESEEGVGSTFTISLPLEAESSGPGDSSNQQTRGALS